MGAKINASIDPWLRPSVGRDGTPKINNPGDGRNTLKNYEEICMDGYCMAEILLQRGTIQAIGMLH